MKFKEYFQGYKINENPPSTFFHKYVNKNIGCLIGYYLVIFKVNPNLITILSSVILWVSFLTYKIEMGLLGLFYFICFTQISYSLDCVDGVVARILNKKSKFGAFLDLSLDRFNMMLFWVFIYSLNIDINIYILITCGMLQNFYCIICIIKEPIYPELKGFVKKQKKNKFKINVC